MWRIDEHLPVLALFLKCIFGVHLAFLAICLLKGLLDEGVFKDTGELLLVSTALLGCRVWEVFRTDHPRVVDIAMLNCLRVRWILHRP
jgi:hypothetical protein